MIRIHFNNFPHWKNLEHLVHMLKRVNELDKGTFFEIDSNGFATPFQVVPLACTITQKNLSYSTTNPNSELESYLEIIRFPYGVKASEAQPGTSGNYLPIARVSGVENELNQRERSYKHLEDQYRDLILNCFPSIRDKLGNAIAFFLSELIENAKDHSEADDFYIFAQYWPALQSFELCMMDNGIGLRGSLSNKHSYINTDEIAVREVIQRQLSARISDVEALPGTGLANTIRIVSNKELESTFTLLSGSFGYSCSNDNCRWINPGTAIIPGTLINISIKEPQERFDIFNYIH